MACENVNRYGNVLGKLFTVLWPLARVSHAEHRANIQLQRKGKQEEASFCTYLTVIATHMHTNKLEDGAGVTLA